MKDLKLFYDVKNGKTKNISSKMANSIISVFPEIHYNWLLTGEGEMLNNPNLSESNFSEAATLVPLLPVTAQGGTLNDFTVQVKDGDEMEKIVSPIKDADFAITISGNSMEPEFPSGAKILIKKINEKAFIEWNKVFVLDTVNGIVLKKLKPSDKEGCVKCVSINADYDTFEVNLKDVSGIYRVLMIMSMK